MAGLEKPPTQAWFQGNNFGFRRKPLSAEREKNKNKRRRKMKLMPNLKKMMLESALTLGMSLSLVSAKPSQVTPVAAQVSASVEVMTVGGTDDRCYASLGLATGLAIAALTPCSILCAVGAWYVGAGGALIF